MDEARLAEYLSSQTGEAAAKLKQFLSASEIKELEDGGEVSTEDILAAQMAAKAGDSGITYVAFTGTPPRCSAYSVRYVAIETTTEADFSRVSRSQ